MARPRTGEVEPGRRSEIRDLLREAAGMASLFTRTDSSPWTGVSFRDGGAAQNAIDMVRRLACDVLPALRASLCDLDYALGFAAPQTFAAVFALADLLLSASAHIDLYSADVYKQDLTEIIAQLENATSPIKAMWLSLTSRDYKAATRRAITLRKGGWYVYLPMQFVRVTQDDDVHISYWAAFLCRWSCIAELAVTSTPNGATWFAKNFAV